MENREKMIYKVTLVGTAVNVMLIVVKFAAGILGRSSALIADAVHSLTDFVSDIIVLFFVRISGKPRDEAHEYGHGKYETFASMIIGVILFITGVGLLVNSLRLVLLSLGGEELPEPTAVALIVAVISIIFKEILFRYTVREGHRLHSDAVVANAWHHRSDAISSVGTLAGIGGAMFLGRNWRILDPVAAAVVSLFIIKAGYDIIKPALNELLEGALPRAQRDEVEKIITGVAGVEGFHNLRTRKIGNAIAVDVHVKMDGNLRLTEAHDIATRVERALQQHFGPTAMIYIHMEPLHR